MDLGLNPGLATYMLCDLRLLSLSEPQFPISKMRMISLSKEAHCTMPGTEEVLDKDSDSWS